MHHLEKYLRKQLYPLGRKNYPTLVQKHFNGAVPCQTNLLFVMWENAAGAQEATVLAKWLKGVTLALAAAHPGNEHNEFLAVNWLYFIKFLSSQIGLV